MLVFATTELHTSKHSHIVKTLQQTYTTFLLLLLVCCGEWSHVSIRVAVLSLSPSTHQLVPLLIAAIKFYWYGLYLCPALMMVLGESGGMLPGKFFQIRCSHTASKANHICIHMPQVRQYMVKLTHHSPQYTSVIMRHNLVFQSL